MASESCAFRSLKFWANAFIPRDVPGNTRTIHREPRLLNKIVGTPNFLPRDVMVFPDPRLVNKTVFVTRFGCGLTDQRMFSSELEPTYDFGGDKRLAYRVHSRIDIDLKTNRYRQRHATGRSVEVSCMFETIEHDEEGDTQGMLFKDFHAQNFPQGRKEITVKLQVSKGPAIGVVKEAAATALSLMPIIDFEGTLHIKNYSPTYMCLSFAGLVDSYPAYEMYASVNGLEPITLLQKLPGAGSSPQTHLKFREQGVVFFKQLTYDCMSGQINVVNI